jgi:WD40 repeat protein
MRGSIILCDIDTGNMADTSFESIRASQCSIAFSQDGKMIAVSEKRGSVETESPVYLFDVNTGKNLRTLKGHKGLVESIVFSSDGKRLATGSWDSTVLVWDLTAKP